MTIAIVFLVCVVIGVPIALMLGLCGSVHLLSINPDLLVMVPQKLFTSSNSLGLMAIPLFILAGDLMGLSGDVKRLCDFARALLKHVRGGLCYVTIAVGAMLGASLGSANAEAALLGGVMYPELRKDGYKEEFSAGLIGAVSIIGPIIPPGLTYIIYGVASGSNIKDLFMAGIIPGIMIALALSVVVFFYGRSHQWVRSERSSGKEVWTAFKNAAFSILTPLITLSFIMLGICTPTEAASVLATLILIVGIFIYKKIKLKDLPPLFYKSAILSAAVLLIGAFGGVFGHSLALDQIPSKIANFIIALSNNKYVVLLLINILLLIVGMLMDAVPAIIILVPVLAPIITKFGYDPIHFGFIMCLNLTIGLLTPPVGSVLYTTCAATGVSADKMIKHIWPWVAVLAFVLLLSTYLPDLVTFLPYLLK